MSVLLSVVIPVFNTDFVYLKRCFSIFNRIWNYSIEVIIVDDGSNHQTNENLKLLTRDFNVSYNIIHKKNGGQNSARNLGVLFSHGKYIAFLDSDDCFDESVFGKLLNIASCETSDLIGIDCCELYLPSKKRVYRSFDVSDSSNIDKKKRYLLSDCGELWRFWFKGDFIKSEEKLVENYRLGEDLISIFPIIVNASSIRVVHLYLYTYIKRSDSVMSTLSRDDINSIVDIFDYLLYLYKPLYGNELEWLCVKQLIFFHIPYLIVKYGFRSSTARELMAWINENFPNWRNNSYLQKSFLFHSLTFKLLSKNHFMLFYLYTMVKKML